MRILLIVAFSLLSGVAEAETIVANVNGMVCAMCVTGIERSFRKVAAVDTVKVDLATKKVTLQVKDGQSLDDATVTKTITNAGYAVTGISHSH